jgi:hypothetical protein
MRKNASSVLRAFLLTFLKGGSRKLFLISKRFFLSSSFYRKPRASEFIEIPENSRFCGQQRRTIKVSTETNFFSCILHEHIEKAKLNREIYAETLGCGG